MPTLIDGMLQPYSAHDVQKRVIADFLSMIDPPDTPLIARFGILGAPPPGWNIQNWPGIAPELIHDELHPMADALDGTIASDATTITVDDASVFHESDVILVDSEQMWVTARNTTTQVLTVTRDFAGTTGASHADAAAVTIIGNARIDGDESDISSVVAKSTTKNYLQTFHEEVKVARMQQNLSQYGVDDEMEFQEMKKTKELMKKVEAAIYRGRINTGDAAEARSFGGLDYWINSAGGNTVNAGGVVVQADFDDAMLAAFQDGGNPRVALVSPGNFLNIKNIYDTTERLRIERTETTVGMTIEQVQTPFGTVELLVSRLMPDSLIPLIDPDHFAIMAGDDLFSEPLAKTGDYERRQLVGDFVPLVRHPLEAHAMIIGVTLT